MKTSPLIVPLLGSIALLLAPAQGAEITKLNNAFALNLTTAWNGGVVPGVNDVILWNSTFTAVVPRTVGQLSSMGADLSVQGLKVTNVAGAPNAATLGVGIQNALSANTLTIGTGGIDLSAATQALYLESKIALNANQNWVINNANTNANPTGFSNGEDLAFRAMATTSNLTTATTPFNIEGFTVNTSGTGAVNVSSGYAITNGTINIGNSLFLISGGDSRLVTVGSDVNLNVATGSTLHFQCNSAGVTSGAAITLNGGTLKLVSATATTLVTINGSVNVATASALLIGNNVAGTSVNLNANLTGSAALTVTNSASTTTPLFIGGNNSAYSGTLTFGGTSGRVSRLTAATAAAPPPHGASPAGTRSRSMA